MSAPITAFPSDLSLVSLFFSQRKGVLFMLLLQQEEISKGAVMLNQNLSLPNGPVCSVETLLFLFEPLLDATWGKRGVGPPLGALLPLQVGPQGSWWLWASRKVHFSVLY